jgi:H+-transporting ATPase
LAQYGPNEIEEKKTNALLKFLRYFWGPIPWMIEVAVVLSGVVQHWPDFFIILVLLVANATIGFWEERQAGNAIDALKARLAIKARVKRDGKWITPAAKDLVPGDVIRLRLGDIVPADARLLDGDEVSVDQSALTGESLPASKKPGEAVFSGSIIRRGEIGALVYATGGKTYFGKTAELVQSAVTVSHFQKAVLRIGNYLIALAIALVSLIVAVGIYRGEDVLTVLQFALVLTVAAIPVAMPTVLSVTMAVGARLLAKKQAIVSKLVAIEELAGVDVLCADKTGTLTQNKLTLGDPFCLDKVAADQVILAAALASRAENDDTIDLAVLGGLQDKAALKPFQVTHFQPFDPVHKRTEATVKAADGSSFKVTKGAPQVILELSANSAAAKATVTKAVDDFAARGFRALGVARADGEGKWQLLGVLPLFDPPRTDAKAIVATAAQMGVKIKMVTGDALAIAKETAKTLGMGTNILDGASLGDADSKETAAQVKSVEDADGFAQVFPEHKFHIVDILQRHGHIVGMTGDGVNDAPALKKADCGFAVSGATDAARAAASIVLVAPGLSVIIDAIKESRRIFQRMNSYAMYRIAETLRVLLFMTLAILVFKFYPLTAIMIVMLALLNDGAILSIAYDNVRYRNEPEAWNMRLVLGIATVLGLVGPIAAFGLFFLGDRVLQLAHPQLQTMMYLMLSVAGHLTIFQTRTRGPWWSTRPAWILLAAVCGTQAVATLVAVYGAGLVTPLGWRYAGLVWGYAFAWFLLTDPVKLLAYWVLDTVKADTKPAAKTSPQPDREAAEPADKAEPPHAAAPAAAAPADMATLVGTPLRDIILATVLNDPEAAGRFVAQEITRAEPHESGAQTLEPKAVSEPKADAEPKAAVKPETAAEPQAASKAEGDAEAKPETEPTSKAEAAPPAVRAPDPTSEVETQTEQDAKMQPASDARAESTTATAPAAANADMTALVGTPLGEIILAAVLKDPDAAGHLIAQAISHAKPPEAKAMPKPDAKAGGPAAPKLHAAE